MEQKVGSAFIEIEAKLDKLEGRLTTEIQSIAQKSWQGFTSSFSQALWPLKWAIASVVSVWAFAALSKEIVTLADNLEQAKIAFTTMLWSEEKAIAMLQDLSNFAAKTPFELPEVRQNAKQLLAMGVSAENIIPTLKALGDAAAGTGADMTRLAMNYGQVITQGHLTGRELRDFLVNGIPLLDELAKNAGKSKEEIQNMISSGQISANDVTKAFETMTSEGGEFEDLMYKQSATFTGLWSNFQDQLSQMGERIGAELLPTLKKAISWFSERIENNSEEIEYFAWQIFDTVVTLGEDIFSVAQSLWEIGNDLWEELFDVMDNIVDHHSESVSAIRGDWHDLVYIVQIGVSAIVNAVNMWIKAIWNLGKTAVNAPLNAINTIGEWIKGSLDFLLNKIDWTDTSKVFDWFKNAKKKLFWEFSEDIGNLTNDWIEWWNKLEKSLTNIHVNAIEKRWNMERKQNQKIQMERMKQDLEVLQTRQKQWENLSKDELGRIDRLKKYLWWLNTAFTYWDNKTGGWGGGWSSKQSKAQKEALKEIKEAYHDIEKEINTHNKAIEDAQKKVESLNKKYEELKKKALEAFDEAKNTVKELNKELSNNEDDRVKNLWERYVDLKRKMLEIWENALNVAKNLSRSEIEDKIKGDIYELNGVDPKKLLEYKDLLEEVALIEANTTEEQRKSKDFTEQKSKAQEILNKHLEKQAELEEKKAAALEKQKIAEAFSNGKNVVAGHDKDNELKARYEDEKGALIEITDFKNIQYAQDLYNKSQAILQEKKEIEDKIFFEKVANEELTTTKMRLDQMYTKAHSKEIDKQKSKVDELIQKYHELARAKSWAGGRWARAFGWEVKAWLPYLIWENFKPELFVPSTSGSVVPVNNYNQSKSYHFSGITINTNRAEDFWSEIQNYIGDYT